MSIRYTSWKPGPRRVNTSTDPDHRAQLAFRFKATYASLGLSLDDVAKLLHVTPRTLHNWNSGRYDIPYASFKLLRVLLRYELPDPRWEGWHFSAGKLHTPEGYSIAAHESSWWSLLLRKAEMFSTLYAQVNDLQARLRDGGTALRPGTDGRDAGQGRGAAQVTPTGAAGRAAQQPGPNLLIGHFGTQGAGNIPEPLRWPSKPIDTFPHPEKEVTRG